jgi:hypothetical protein
MTSWRGERAVDWNNALTLAGVFIGAATAAYVGYSKKWPNKPDHPVLTSVGIELGSREQTERLIEQVKRIADVLEDKAQAKIEDKLEDLAEKVDAALRSRPARR